MGIKELEDLLKSELNEEIQELKALDGYANSNFSFKSGNQKFVLKIYSYSEEIKSFLEGQNQVLSILNEGNNTQISPQPIQWNNGEWLKIITNNGKKKIARVLSFLPGTFLGDLDQSKLDLHGYGQTLARLVKKLDGFNHSGIQAYQSVWNQDHFYLNEEFVGDIEDPNIRKIVSYFFQQYKLHVQPIAHKLRKQIIHGDANEWNVLLNAEKEFSFIDFGDCCFSSMINEVAIGLTYLIYDKEDPLAWTNDFLTGFHTIYPLKEEEIDALYYLIAARLCTSLCQSSKSRKLDPANSYATSSEKHVISTLKKWIRINPISLQNQFRESLGLSIKNTDSIQKQLEDRYRHMSPILSVSYHNPLSLEGSAFQYLYTTDGKSILDAYNNIPHVGHCHPKVVEAGQRQMATLNTNTRYIYRQLGEYAEKLLSKFPKTLNRVFFVNSGSAASDLAMRMARAHTECHNFMVMEHGYHGNTQISIDISDYKFSNPKGQGQKPNILKTSIPDTYLGKYTDLTTAGSLYAQDAINDLTSFGHRIGAFVTEPIVGCGGQVPLAPGYLKSLYPSIRKQGGICISDEVQTGFGRVGDYFWGFEAQDVVPDMVILGKPMGNGHPIGAVVCTDEIAKSFEKGVEFFSSFGGNPVSCAIGMAVLDVIDEEGLQQNAKEVGDYYKSLLKELMTDFPQIGDVRGSGLFLGAEIVQPGTKTPNTKLAYLTKNKLRDKNVIISTDGPHDNVLKTKPPLCFTKENAEEVVTGIAEILQDQSY